MSDDLELAIEEEDKEDEEKPFNYGHFRRMMGYVTPYRSRVLLGGLMMVAITGVHLAEPLLMRAIIDLGIVERDLGLINRLALVVLGLRLLAWAAGYVQIKIMNWTGQRVLFDLRQQLFEHIQKLSFSFYDGRPVGKIMSRVTNDVNHIGELVNSGVVQVINQALSLVAIVIILLTMHVQLAILSFCVVPGLIYCFTRLRGRMETAWTNTRKAISSMNAHLNETLTGIQVIQAFGRHDTNSARFDKISLRTMRSYMRAVKFELVFWPASEMVGALGTCLVYVFGVRAVLRGELTIGFLMAFVSYLHRFWGPVSTFSRIYSQMLSAMASAERVFEFLDTKPEVYDRPGAIDIGTIAGDIEFEDVCFAYKGDAQVLHGISFSVKAGETLALVGPTGGGKSTIANLVARFYDPTRGVVRIDGHDLRDVSLASLRSQFGIVLQDTFIFSGTIAENIRYGRTDATDEEVEAAAKAVRAHDFIMRTEHGYDTEVQERGASLSSGQRQLIAFARALLADPRILILDEATAHIDSETERAVQEALRTLLAGRTAMVIAHRLSTIEQADRILVIDRGTIAEQGTHRELLMLRGTYRRLYTIQYQLERDLPVDSIINGQRLKESTAG
ncbi:MAG: ABC transporter ATP-binding protein [Bacillota bacterium]